VKMWMVEKYNQTDVLSRIGWIQQNRPQYRFYGRWLVEALGDTNKTETLTMSVLSRFCCLHESESWKSRFYCVLFLSANQKPGNLGFVIRALRLHVLHSESIKHKKNLKISKSQDNGSINHRASKPEGSLCWPISGRVVFIPRE
jgi:hypothetical protein